MSDKKASRRDLLEYAAALGLTGLGLAGVGFAEFDRPALGGKARPRLIVVGGGAAGATVAKYVARDSQGRIDVTLVEPQNSYVSCFHSNLMLAGLTSLAILTHDYDVLETHYGIHHLRQRATAIDRDKEMVVLDDGRRLFYDRLVIAPGIALDYDSVPGWGRAAEEAMPHGWRGGKQLMRLKAQLDAVPNKRLIVILPPPDPARCPPAPYERASMMAYALKTSGRADCRIVILDCKERFSMMGLFLDGWERHFPGMIEWLPPSIHEGVKHVDPATMTVETGFTTYKACALVNVIPAQAAGHIAAAAGLTDRRGFCPIAAADMASTFDPKIFVIGDAAMAGDMPKSAFAANSQAKIVAAAVRAALLGQEKAPPHYASTCWGQLDRDDCVKFSGSYAAVDNRITEVASTLSKLDDSTAQRRANAEDSIHWYAKITQDMFGAT